LKNATSPEIINIIENEIENAIIKKKVDSILSLSKGHENTDFYTHKKGGKLSIKDLINLPKRNNLNDIYQQALIEPIFIERKRQLEKDEIFLKNKMQIYVTLFSKEKKENIQELEKLVTQAQTNIASGQRTTHPKINELFKIFYTNYFREIINMDTNGIKNFPLFFKNFLKFTGKKLNMTNLSYYKSNFEKQFITYDNYQRKQLPKLKYDANDNRYSIYFEKK
jgi:hypothetical protein